MPRPLPPIEFTNLRGLNSADPPTRLAEGMGVDAHNVLLEPLSLGRRRPSMVAVDTSTGPTGPVHQLLRHQAGTTKTGAAGAQLWAFQALSNVIFRLVNGAWSSTTSVDTTDYSPSTNRPYGATFNGKFFLSVHSSAADRLHVWDGTTLRRVGVVASSAPTAADSGGAGTYSGTRYYKVRFQIVSGSTFIATSELSAALSFTPSGANASVTVTKPTTPDSATHWQVYGSADGVNYYALAGQIVVATTTYVDSAATSSYSAGEIAPTAGLYVPPCSVKYLLAANNQLFMAGSWNTAASTGITAPRNSRVWFTQPLGALDNTGEDEAVVQTISTKDWVDCGENDGDAIVGLAGPMDGAVYVFKDRSIWRLSPTGQSDQPYRADQVTPSLGATWQDGICLGEDGAGNPAIYFRSLSGPKRIIQGGVIEDLGADVRDYNVAAYTSISEQAIVKWDAVRRVVWWLSYGTRGAYAFQPQFEQRTERGVRGGWTRHTIAIDSAEVETYCCALYEVSGVLVPYLGGEGPDVLGAATESLASMSGSARRDISAVSFTPSVTSGYYQPAGLLGRFGFGNAVIEWAVADNTDDFAHSVSVASVIGGPTAVTGTTTGTTTDTTYTQTVVQERLESVQLADVLGAQAVVTWDTTEDGAKRPRIHGVTIPIAMQEPT